MSSYFWQWERFPKARNKNSSCCKKPVLLYYYDQFGNPPNRFVWSVTSCLIDLRMFSKVFSMYLHIQGKITFQKKKKNVLTYIIIINSSSTLIVMFRINYVFIKKNVVSLWLPLGDGEMSLVQLLYFGEHSSV